MKSICKIAYDGSKHWYHNGLLHRTDGPAVEHELVKSWYYKGKQFNVSSQEEFERYIKLLVFL